MPHDVTKQTLDKRTGKCPTQEVHERLGVFMLMHVSAIQYAFVVLFRPEIVNVEFWPLIAILLFDVFRDRQVCLHWIGWTWQ